MPRTVNLKDYEFTNAMIKYYPDGTAITTVGTFKVLKNKETSKQIKATKEHHRKMSLAYWNGIESVLPVYDPSKDDTLTFRKPKNKASDKNRSIRRAKTAIIDYIKCLRPTHFVTLTFDPQKLDSTDYDKVQQAFTTFINKAKKRKGSFHHLAVPELHADKKKYHIHMVISAANLDAELYDTGRKDKNGNTVYNWINYEYGYSTVVKIDDQKNDAGRIANYMAKYMTKEIFDAIPSGKKKYWSSKGLPAPEREYLNIEESIIDEMIECSTYHSERIQTIQWREIDSKTYEVKDCKTTQRWVYMTHESDSI